MHTASPSGATTVPTILATPSPDGSVRCGVCAHRCLVRPGRRGICGVRENRDGQLVSLAYGAVVAIGLDPIEKKPLFHVAPGSTAYSIATAGCPFHCTFCQNWEIAQGPRLGLDLPTRPLPPDGVVAEATMHGAESVAYTYVEPTVFLEYALDTARLARQAGLRNLFITDGYATPEAVEPPGPGPRRRERRPEVVRRRLLPEGVRRAPGTGARVDRRHASGGHLAGADDARHPRSQRRRRAAPGAGALDRGDPGHGDALARQPLLPHAPACSTYRRRHSRPSGGWPTWVARPDSSTSTSGTRPSSASRTRIASGADGSSSSDTATGCGRT